jgi:hypothetical protein
MFPKLLVVKKEGRRDSLPFLHFKESLLHFKEPLLHFKESLLHFKEPPLHAKERGFLPFV